MSKRILSIGIAVTMLFAVVTLGGCSARLPYNAVLFDRANEWMHIEFLRENQVNDAWFWNWEIGTIEEPDVGEMLPNYRIFMVKEEEMFNEIFVEFPPGVDFAREMLIVYMAGISDMQRNFRISNLYIAYKQLNIHLQYRFFAKNPQHYLIIFVIRIDRQNINNVHIAVDAR